MEPATTTVVAITVLVIEIAIASYFIKVNMANYKKLAINGELYTKRLFFIVLTPTAILIAVTMYLQLIEPTLLASSLALVLVCYHITILFTFLTFLEQLLVLIPKKE